ncbi:hypothetical protein [Rhodanobacter lindaniclasticus]|uniref:Uncharacterized protein n=1 Tax=Rhodanobacter lindaniclasticus TaxID=75310 RepID=A0A4S3KE21_9GAMM|nr:hypothetical protein [Rhodanobacter lindaniclasticus]THD06164.1 hypothetical protein B1991_14570 [Rhodanobacter lindaniclasticus]
MDVYEIRSIKDFLSVPPDKRVAALCDFAMWLAICDMMADKFTPEEVTVGDVFKWKDDGISGCSEINIRTPEQPE